MNRIEKKLTRNDVPYTKNHEIMIREREESELEERGGHKKPFPSSPPFACTYERYGARELGERERAREQERGRGEERVRHQK